LRSFFVAASFPTCRCFTLSESASWKLAATRGLTAPDALEDMQTWTRRKEKTDRLAAGLADEIDSGVGQERRDEGGRLSRLYRLLRGGRIPLAAAPESRAGRKTLWIERAVVSRPMATRRLHRGRLCPVMAREGGAPSWR
jgi:hypothetical protein